MTEQTGNRRPVVLPEVFSGEGDFSHWIRHFESVAVVNGWEEDSVKLQWLCCVPYAYFIPYAYGTYHTRICIWHDRTRMVWLFVPYAYGYYTITDIAIANTVYCSLP